MQKVYEVSKATAETVCRNVRDAIRLRLEKYREDVHLILLNPDNGLSISASVPCFVQVFNDPRETCSEIPMVLTIKVQVVRMWVIKVFGADEASFQWILCIIESAVKSTVEEQLSTYPPINSGYVKVVFGGFKILA